MWLKSLFTNPWFSGLASICSIISIALWFYQDEAALKFSISPIPAIVVKAGQANKMNVIYEGKTVTSDVTAVQVAIWNAGSKAIRQENILEPVVIKIDSKSRILEATIRQMTRKVCTVSLDENRIDRGELGIRWKILEKNDGALIQIVYEGSPGITLKAEGIIEGQGDAGASLTTKPLRKQSAPSQWLAFWMMIIMLILTGLLLTMHKNEDDKYRQILRLSPSVFRPIIRLSFYGLIPFMVFAFCFLAWLALGVFKSIPPFEF